MYKPEYLIELLIISLLFFSGLLFRFDSKRLHSIPPSVKEKQRPQACHVNYVFSGTPRSRGFCSPIFASILQRHYPSVSYLFIESIEY